VTQYNIFFWGLDSVSVHPQLLLTTKGKYLLLYVSVVHVVN